MSIHERLAQVQKLYSDNVRRLGIVSSAVGWNSEESHLLRFAKLAEVLEVNGEAITVNDYGCGYGALLAFLVRSLGVTVAAYHGYDISLEMLEAARRELSWFDGDLRMLNSAEISTEADYSFACGTFNVKLEASDDEWIELVRRSVTGMAAKSKRGFAFNLLTSYVDWKEPHLYYAEPCYWFDYCKKNFSRRVSLLHDTGLFEWTLVVKK